MKDDPHPTFSRILEHADSPWTKGADAARDAFPETVRLGNLVDAYVRVAVRQAILNDLRTKANAAIHALRAVQNPVERKRAADDAIGRWLSGAQDDTTVCADMKADIEEWFKATEQLEQVHKLTRLISQAAMVLRSEVVRPDVVWFDEAAQVSPAAYRRVTLFRSELGMDYGKKPATLAVHCTECGAHEPNVGSVERCLFYHCPLRPLLTRTPEQAAQRAHKAIKHHPKRKHNARTTR